MSAPESLRAELARLVDDAPVAGERLPRVHARARRIRRNRTATALTSAVAAVVVAVLVATNVAGTNRSAPIDPLAPSPTTLPTGVLVVARDGTVGSLSTMTDRELEPVRDLRLAKNATPIAVAGGRALAYDAAHDLVLIDPKQPGPARVLLRPSGAVAHNIPFSPPGASLAWTAIPGVGPRLLVRMLVERGGARVWLVTTATEAAIGNGPYELYAMDMSGHVDRRPVRVPRGVDPVVAGKTGIYGMGSSGPVPPATPDFVRVDRSGRVHVVFRNTDSGYEADAYGEAILGSCVANQCDGATTRLFDADTGRAFRLSAKAPHGGFLFLFQPYYSVDGRYFVDQLGAALPLIGGNKDVDNGFAWVVVDTRTGTSRLVPHTLRYGVQDNGVPIFAGWSGDRLVWIEQLAHRSLIGAYLPVSGRSVVTSVPTRGLALIGAS